MPALLSMFATWLMGMLGTLVAYGARYALARVIISFGIGILTVTGVSSGLSYLEGLIQGDLTGAAAWIASIMGLMGFDSFVNIIFSAFVMKLTMKGMQQGGNISTMFIKGQE
ncbi:MAG: DUF2523 family protein [Acidithiobacillus sp.]